MPPVQLSDIEQAEVTILVDNYTDLLLPDTETIKRLRTPPPDAPRAEHGLAYLVTVYAGGTKHTILMDAGISGDCLTHNAALLARSLAGQFGVVKHRIEDVTEIVLSHGHFDHFGGLNAFLQQAGNIPEAPCRGKTAGQDQSLSARPGLFYRRNRRIP